MRMDRVYVSLIFIVCGLTFFMNICLADDGQKLTQGKIHSEIHRTNIGKVIFMQNSIPIKDYREQDFISVLDLNKSKNLYFSGFLSKPLTNYLHELAPDLSLEELTKKGNYQFSFYVDSKLIYTENLNFDAGLASQKNNNTILSKPLFSELNEDSWGRFLWMRFMHFGGEKVLSEGRYNFKMEIRPYVKTPDIKVGKLIATGQILIDIIKPVVNEQQIAIQPIHAKSGWKVSNESYDIKKIRALNKKIAQNDFKQISSIVVIKNGELLLEEYFNGSERASLHDPRSVGKSFASTMLGIAIGEGYIRNEQQKISDFYNLKNFNNYSTEKTKVSLKDLLTMSSGFDGDDSDQRSAGNEENMYPTDDWVKFTLNLSMDEKKTVGKHWAYFTAGVVLLGDILDKTVPGDLEKYTHNKLFEPLGIKNYQWQYTPQDVANTAGGLSLTALDFAKYGQLYKNGGTWQGNQIIPQEWVKESLSKQIARSAEMGSGHYGYLFWHDTFTFDNQSYDVAYATGNGGNKIFIFKDIPFVIVINAKAYNKAYAHKQVGQMMANYILPAILN